jgi:hypothetical protein
VAELDLNAVKARVDKAHAHIGDLCTGRSRWKMTIPVNPERDSDLILTEALVDAERLMAEVNQLRAQRDKVLAILAANTPSGGLSAWLTREIRAAYADPTSDGAR